MKNYKPKKPSKTITISLLDSSKKITNKKKQKLILWICNIGAHINSGFCLVRTDTQNMTGIGVDRA
jgi:hypothetical protein